MWGSEGFLDRRYMGWALKRGKIWLCGHTGRAFGAGMAGR